MNKKIHSYHIIAFLLLFARIVPAQVNDAGLWLTFSGEKKVSHSLSFSLSEEYRMNENITELGEFFTDAGINYKFSKFIKASANYRFINKRRLDDSYSKRNRYYFDVSLHKKYKPVILTFRTRFQNQYDNVSSNADGKTPEYHLRNKLTSKFDFDKKYEPYIYAEIYSPMFSGKGIMIDNTRYCAGLEYQFNRMNSIDCFYMIEQEYNVKDPKRDFILGFGYNLTF